MGEDPLEDLRLLDEEADQVKTRRRESGRLHVGTTLGHVRATLAARSKSHLGGALPTPPGERSHHVAERLEGHSFSTSDSPRRFALTWGGGRPINDVEKEGP